MPAATHQLVPCLLQARKTSRRERVFDLLFNRKARGDERAIYAHLALTPAEKAIIFVHGFAGRALQTWTLFPEMLQGEPKTAGYDLIFFEYDSFSTQLGNIVSRLKTFLSEIMTNASPTINRGLARPDHRPPGFAYKNIVIVAHSLGAVVTRRTLLDYQGNQTTWVPHTEFMLFAPADRGAFGTALVAEALEGVPFGTVFGAGIKGLFPALDALERESEDLKNLRDDTLALTLNGKNAHLFARLVVYASDESVTKKAKFVVTEPEAEIAGTLHTTVCKPDASRQEPVTHLLSVLR